MTGALGTRVAAVLSRDIAPEVRAFGEELARREDVLVVLFYGSNLRTGSLEGVLDFYVLLAGEAETGVWPRVTYREWLLDGRILRAKIATMTMAKFAQAASGQLLDTTIWARFCQPSAIVWAADDAAHERVQDAICDAIKTAARLGAVVGPDRGPEDAFWSAMFSATYRAEFRVEAPGRAQSIIDLNRAYFTGLLPPALDAADVSFTTNGDVIRPEISPERRRSVLSWWKRRRRLGKILNLVRLVRASTTFEGASRYAAWKIERHTGMAIEITPWRDRHPVLAAPGVLFSIWRHRRDRA